METKKEAVSALRILAAYLAALALVAGVHQLTKGAAKAAEAPAAGTYTPGTYSGTGTGFGGDVTATLTVGPNGGIDDVVLDGPNETPAVGGQALPTLREQVLSAQGAEIDGVSGATLTTGAVKDAVAQAVEQASQPGTPAVVG